MEKCENTMLRINQIKLKPGHSEKELKEELLKHLKIKENELTEYHIFKKSIDARKGEVQFCYAIVFKVKNEKQLLSKNKKVIRPDIVRYSPDVKGTKTLKSRIVVVGSGPCGLFAAYLLAEKGYRPLLIERGENVEKRKESVDNFWKTNVLNTESNVQFGEGGAGTFSDGKLNTLVKDKYGRNRFVLETFVKFGAPEDILYMNKPHIGTDILCDVVKNMRENIISNGGEVRFNTCLTNVKIHNGSLVSIELNHSEWTKCEHLILALGHSARDTFGMLYDKGIYMEQKSFAVGVRVQHPQKMINLSQYKTNDNLHLPAADYKVVANLKNGRSVYSFCMCPGGYVVNSSSEEKRVAINGMSYRSRDGENANSAIIVSVTPDDFDSESPLAGIEFQRKLEEKSYIEGNGNIPVQLLKDFRAGIKSQEFGEVKPAIKGGYTFANLRNVLPDFISDSIVEGMDMFSGKIKNFNRDDVILAGVESRTSSPLRIRRDDNFESNIKGIYPCGEGAGYAGGITSAAMDGIKVFDGISLKYKPF